MSSMLNRQWCIADTNFDGTVLRLGTNIPIEILHAANNAHLHEFSVIIFELSPFGQHWRRPRQGKSAHHVAARRIKPGVGPLIKRRRRRQGDEMRHEARKRMRQIQRIVTIGHADMNMLAEHGEGLGQIAVFFVQIKKSLTWRDPLFVPMLERMCSTAGDINIEMLGATIERSTQAFQFFNQVIDTSMNTGVQLNHALRHFQLDLLLQIAWRNPGQQINGIAGEVVIAPVDQLQFQLDAHGKWGRGGKWQNPGAAGRRRMQGRFTGSGVEMDLLLGSRSRHSRPLSPDLINANCVAIGPNNSSTIRLPASNGTTSAVVCGYRVEIVCIRPRPTSVIGKVPRVSKPACFQFMRANRANTNTPQPIATKRAAIRISTEKPTIDKSLRRIEAPTVTNSITTNNSLATPNSNSIKSYWRSRFFDRMAKISIVNITGKCKACATPMASAMTAITSTN